jgi:hypothetical protein
MLFKAIQNPDLTKLDYPFAFIRDINNDPDYYDYNVKDFYEGLPDEEPIKEIGNFPKNISEYYWIHEGENDEEPWKLLCKIHTPKCDVYGYYTAWCDYTGFDCQGGMRLVVSKSIFNLYDKALTSKDKKQLEKELKK